MRTGTNRGPDFGSCGDEGTAADADLVDFRLGPALSSACRLVSSSRRCWVPVMAVIVGSATNHDGRSGGLTPWPTGAPTTRPARCAA
ncbi:hypothetical protein BN159_0144 [Streptomyces davaonensis JCM 4913]|uniref:Uncharacterized protein n=1 Tax=Streptomyces davaonensis (strain DSM 101723 / JCM 4913 / KCC S-0913 / 768) TaxID=1214101 RepID=K4QUA7_STRDJ|nr:hypothetical protein [Streptomyces davaonensis]CCK24523.1 hypothetical protein BN159_0144 [Streptomyces davaonensis JCM 4913]